MIQIKNLTKIYSAQSKNKVVALNDINLTLPDKGLVFVVGKSGSGKSTLLNMFSGLDKPTSGEILIGNKDISKFTSEEMDNYRSSVLGFVFQDFHLVENLTVYENIRLSLSLNNIENDSAIKDTLKQVGLAGYENRRIQELSGGECQRVAMARSLVKNPSIILADEPTGNLDSKTAIQILKILKKISKKNLVVIVSHNLDDAYTYGDRIVELKDGKIVCDKAKKKGYSNNFKIKEGVLTLPYKKPITSKQLDQMKSAIDDKQISLIVQLDDGFKEVDKNEQIESKPIEYKESNLLKKEVVSLAKNFFKGQKFICVVTVVLVTLLITLFGLVQSFVMFDAKNVFGSVFEEYPESAVAMYKGVYNEYDEELETQYMVPVTDVDKQAVLDAGYTGKIYSLYNYNFQPAYDTWERSFYKKFSDRTNLITFYMRESYGVLVCDKEYLIKTFGVDGKLEVLAGDVDAKDGVIITDYMADSFLYHKKSKATTYDGLIGVYYSQFSPLVRGRIKAIIKTDYTEKYGAFRDEYFGSFAIGAKKDFRELMKTDICKEFFKDVVQNLGIAYSFDTGFLNSVNTGDRQLARLGNTEFVYNGESMSTGNSVSFVLDKTYGINLADNEIMMSWSEYNNYFGTMYDISNYQTDFEPHNITIICNKRYSEFDKANKEIFIKEVKIVGLIDGHNTCNKEMLNYFAQFEFRPYAYYLDNPESLGGVYTIIEDQNYYLNMEEYGIVLKIRDIVETFKEFFFLIVLSVLVVSALAISFFANFIISKNRKNIGIMRALGVSVKDVLKVFALQILFVSMIVVVFAVVGYFGFIALGNMLLQNTFLSLFKSEVISSLTLLVPNILVLFINLMVMVIVSLITILLQMAVLKRINVIKIIKMQD